MQVVGLLVDERQRDERRRDDPQEQAAWLHERLASRPCGRANIIKMKNTNAST